MKSCYEIQDQLNKRYNQILSFDKIEIDNPDRYHPKRINYFDRLGKIISIIQKMFPNPSQIKIGDFACAQSNLSLLLAELGYKVVAVDVNPIFVEYSKMKYEKGKIEWIVGNINELDFPASSLDMVVAGELIEHCAYPEEIIAKILNYVRPGGLLILTTPNGAKANTVLPTFEQVFNREERKIFERRQFRPGGEDHLFLFKLAEIAHVLPKETKIVEKGYLGGASIINKLAPLLRFFSIRGIELAIGVLRKMPVINRMTFNNIYIVLRKNL